MVFPVPFFPKNTARLGIAKVVSSSISNDPDCRPCDLKQEFNRQINASSAVIFVVGDMTAYRKAGGSCSRVAEEKPKKAKTYYCGL